MKKLFIKPHLYEAARSLINNKTILLGLSEEQKEVLKIADEQNCRTWWREDGEKSRGGYIDADKTVAFCLSDDIEIIPIYERPDWLISEPANEYHAKAGKEYLSSHLLAEYRNCPLMFYKKVNGLISSKDSSAYAFGRAAHTLILEGKEVFEKEYAVGGPINPKTGKTYGSNTQAFAAWSEEVGKPVISSDEFITLELIHQSVKTHQTATALLDGGFAEGVVRVEYAKIPCQIRTDYFHPKKGLVDLKTCDDLGKFEYDAIKYGYLYQLAFYSSVLQKASGQYYHCHIIAVEKKEPYRTGVWYVTPEVLEEAAIENEIAIKKLQESYSNNVWPTNYEDTRILEHLNFRR